MLGFSIRMSRSTIRPLCLALSVGLLAACQRSNDPVVATVGKSVITQSDIEARLQQTPTAYQQYATTQEGQHQFLEILIREKVLLEEARKAGPQNDPAYHQAVEHFEKEWKHQFEEYKESVLVDSYLKRLRVKELAVSDADVERFYNDHQADYTHPLELLVSHILPELLKATRRPRLARLKKGESFEKLAMEISKDPATAARGAGCLAPFQPDVACRI